MKARLIIVVILSIVSLGTIITYHALKSTKKTSPDPYSLSSQNDYNDVSNPPAIYSSDTPATPAVSDLLNKEEPNKKGQRRPAQYVHVCTTSDSITYVTQGTPKCLGSDTFTTDYDSSVPGTALSSPCETTSGTKRYVYISNSQVCPSGTKLLFYNTLGNVDSTRLEVN